MTEEAPETDKNTTLEAEKLRKTRIQAMNPIAVKLRELKNNGLSYEEMAVYAKVNYNTLRNVFQDHRPVSYRTIMRLYDAKLITTEERKNYARWRESFNKHHAHEL